MSRKMKSFLLFLIIAMPASLYAQTEDLVAGSEPFHEVLKAKFIEGNPIFMSFVAITLIIGLTFCIERIIYLPSQMSTPRNSSPH